MTEKSSLPNRTQEKVASKDTDINSSLSTRKKTRLSIFLIGGLLLVSLAAMIGINLYYASEGDNLEVVVVDSDNTEHRFSLNENSTHTITTSLGYNTIEVENGSVKVSQADCPNQTCVETGAVHEPGSMIVCLPHELIVTIEDNSGEKTDNGIDTVSS